MSMNSDFEQQPSSELAVQAKLQPCQSTLKRRCRYCYGIVPDGQQFHDDCKGELEWEQNMRFLNAHWRPAVNSDY